MKILPSNLLHNATFNQTDTIRPDQSGVSMAVNIADILFLNLPCRDGEGEDEDEMKMNI